MNLGDNVFNYNWTSNIPRQLNTDFMINLDLLKMWDEYSITNVADQDITATIAYIVARRRKAINDVFIIYCNYADRTPSTRIITEFTQFSIDKDATICLSRTGQNEITIKY